MQNYQVQSILRSIPTLQKIDSSRRTGNDLPTADKTLMTAKRTPAKVDRGKIRALAEAVILQSIEDLWSKAKRKRSVEFFMGDGFSLYADMAGMKIIDRLRLFRMLRKLDPRLFDSRHARKLGSIVNPPF
jgi:dihydrofolate reductase